MNHQPPLELYKVSISVSWVDLLDGSQRGKTDGLWSAHDGWRRRGNGAKLVEQHSPSIETGLGN